jgi:hypothetical protein
LKSLPGVIVMRKNFAGIFSCLYLDDFLVLLEKIWNYSKNYSERYTRGELLQIASGAEFS